MPSRSWVAAPPSWGRAGAFRRFSQRASSSTNRDNSAACAASRLLTMASFISTMTSNFRTRTGNVAPLTYYEVRLPAVVNMTAKQEEGTNTEAGATILLLVRLPSPKIPDTQHLCMPKRHRVKYGALGALWYDVLPREPIPNGEPPMSQTEKPVAWVVYLMTLHNNAGGLNAV